MSWLSKKHPHGVLENHVSLIEWSGDVCQPRIHLRKVEGLRSMCSKCFETSASIWKKLQCTFHKNEMVWMKHKSHYTSEGVTVTLSNQRHPRFLQVASFKVTFGGSGIHQRHHQSWREVATVAIPSWKLSLARSWPRHEFPCSPKWGQRSHGTLSK